MSEIITTVEKLEDGYRYAMSVTLDVFATEILRQRIGIPVSLMRRIIDAHNIETPYGPSTAAEYKKWKKDGRLAVFLQPAVVNESKAIADLNNSAPYGVKFRIAHDN